MSGFRFDMPVGDHIKSTSYSGRRFVDSKRDLALGKVQIDKMCTSKLTKKNRQIHKKKKNYCSNFNYFYWIVKNNKFNNFKELENVHAKKLQCLEKSTLTDVKLIENTWNTNANYTQFIILYDIKKSIFENLEKEKFSSNNILSGFFILYVPRSTSFKLYPRISIAFLLEKDFVTIFGKILEKRSRNNDLMEEIERDNSIIQAKRKTDVKEIVNIKNEYEDVIYGKPKINLTGEYTTSQYIKPNCDSNMCPCHEQERSLNQSLRNLPSDSSECDTDCVAEEFTEQILTWANSAYECAPSLRSSCKMLATPDFLFIFGGSNPNITEKALKDVYRFNLLTRRWTKLKVDNLPTSLISYSICWDPNIKDENLIGYLFGGSEDPDGNVMSNKLYKFTIDPEGCVNFEELNVGINQTRLTINKSDHEANKNRFNPKIKVDPIEEKNAQEQERNAQEQERNAQEQEKNAQEQEKNAQEQGKNIQEQEKNAQEQERNAQEQEKNAQEQERNAEEKNAQEQEKFILEEKNSKNDEIYENAATTMTPINITPEEAHKTEKVKSLKRSKKVPLKPSGRCGSAMIMNSDGKIYIIGGVDNKTYLLDVWVVDTKKLIWQPIIKNTNNLKGRYTHEIVIIEEKILLLGGGDENWSAPFDKIDAFDIKTQKFIQIETLPDGNNGYPSPRKFHSVVKNGNDIYIIGGWIDNEINENDASLNEDNEEATIFEDIWKLSVIKINDRTYYQWTKTVSSLKMALFFHASAVTPEGCVYTFGGCIDANSMYPSNKLQRFWIKTPELKQISMFKELMNNPNLVNEFKKQEFERESFKLAKNKATKDSSDLTQIELNEKVNLEEIKVNLRELRQTKPMRLIRLILDNKKRTTND